MKLCASLFTCFNSTSSSFKSFCHSFSLCLICLYTDSMITLPPSLVLGLAFLVNIYIESSEFCVFFLPERILFLITWGKFK